ncbi:hypothetical protein ACNSOL_11835 (plasmid) [Aliarcobacter lanthieri]|uniref:hypothetical protein n=1 Tax=Aliarcobacter lanthieri TaxID=1355374 RepID=UPI003AAAC61E
MKKLIYIGLLSCSSLFAANCDDLLKEADKYLQRVPLCDVSAEKNANIALVYYKRYEICRYQYESSNNSYRSNIAKTFKIHPFVDDSKPFECEKHKN